MKPRHTQPDLVRWFRWLLHTFTGCFSATQTPYHTEQVSHNTYLQKTYCACGREHTFYVVAK